MLRFLPSKDWRAASVSENPGSFAGKRSEERRVGKECRSLCDWSSDVCSSDLTHNFQWMLVRDAQVFTKQRLARRKRLGESRLLRWKEIGRASCRERV